MRSTIKVEDSLTILVPLKGRENLTKRLLKYFTHLELPFKILFADGGNGDNSSWINKDHYPSLNIEYHHFGADNNIHKWMRKMSLAMKKIKTPLTMTVDNDDFISLNGVKEGIKFLSENDNYTSYRGSVMSLRKPDKTAGMYRQPSIIGDNVFERFNIVVNHRNAAYHDIIRTPIMDNYFNMCYKSESNDLQCMLTLHILWQALYGNTLKCHTHPFYFHQPGRSTVQNKNLYSKHREWYRDGQFPDSMSIIISAVSNAIYKQNNELNLENIKNEISLPLVKFYLNENNVKNDNIINKEVEIYKNESTRYDDTFSKNLKYINLEPNPLTNILIEDLNLNYNQDIRTIRKF